MLRCSLEDFSVMKPSWSKTVIIPTNLSASGSASLAEPCSAKRELFFALEGFRDLEYAEDTDLWERASKLFSVKKIEEPKTYVYRQTDDSITLNY